MTIGERKALSEQWTLKDRIRFAIKRIKCLVGLHEWWENWEGVIPEFEDRVRLLYCIGCGRCDWQCIEDASDAAGEDYQ